MSIIIAFALEGHFTITNNVEKSALWTLAQFTGRVYPLSPAEEVVRSALGEGDSLAPGEDMPGGEGNG